MSGESLKQNKNNGLERDSEKSQKGLQDYHQNPDQRELQVQIEGKQETSLNTQSRKVINDSNYGSTGGNLKMEIPDVPT